MKPNTPPLPASELRGVLARFKNEFRIVGLFSLVANLLMLAPTLYMLQVYDRVMVSQNELTLLALSLITLFLFAVLAFSEWARSRLLIRLGMRLARELNRRIFTATFEARLQRAEELALRSFGDLTELRQFLTGAGLFAFFDAPWAPLYLFVLYLLHPLLGAVSLVGGILIGTMAWLTSRHVLAPALRAQEAQSRADLYLHGKLRNAEVVEVMGMQAGLLRRWRVHHERYLALGGEAADLDARIKSLTKFVRYSLQSVILGTGALLVIDGQLTPWVMVIGGVLMGRAVAPVEALIGSWRQLVSAWEAFRRLEALLQQHPSWDEEKRRERPAGALALENVVATAPGRERPILQGLSVSFGAGEVVGIIGPSGSGKSTLARVALGLWPDIEGEVRLDGRPLVEWSRQELGPHVGYLPQDVQLFDGTVAENIARLGRIDPGGVITAAQLAGVHELIFRLPRGYDTQVGVAGTYLSGGQRQRIGLARALYGQPRLLVLDEPNANLDDQGERALVETLEKLKAQGHTILLITHRRSVLATADRILMLNDGQLQWYGPRKASPLAAATAA